VFLNDALVNSIAANGLYTTPTLFSLGCATYTTANAFNGYIRDVRIDKNNVPYIHLPFGTILTDVLGNSVVTAHGMISYNAGFTETYALNLVNSVGGTPDNYVIGTFSYIPTFTVTGRFNLQSYPSSGVVSTIFSMGTDSQTFLLIQCCNNSNLFGVSYFSGIVFWLYSVSNTPMLIGTADVSTNQWNSFRIIYEETGMISAYLNDTLAGSISGVALLNTMTKYAFGSLVHAAATAFNGYVSDLRIYSGSLHPTGRSLTMIAGDSTNGNLIVSDTVNQYVYRSSNSGDSWKSQIISGAPGNILSISLSSSGTYAFMTYDSNNSFMSQRSEGLTTEWTTLNGSYYPIVTYSNNNQYQAAISVVSSFSLGYDVTASSNNYGATWINGADLGSWPYYMAADSTGRYVVVVIDDINPSVYRSTDYGVTFSMLENSPTYDATGINCLACDSTGQLIYAGAYDGNVYLSTDAGVNWTSVSLPDSVYWIACSHTGQYVYANVSYQFLYSTDYGMTWTSGPSITSYGIEQIVCDWSGQYLVVACGVDGVYRSTDYGQNWNKTSVPSSANVGNHEYYYSIGCNSTGNRMITMEANSGVIYISTDAGTTWVPQYTPGSKANEAFMGVSISPDGTRYMAGFWAPGSYSLTSGSPDIPNAIPCFLEGTQIMCFINGVEQYKAVETIRPGTLVKTSRDGYRPVKLIGSRSMNNPGTADRDKNSLYLCTKTAYPELTADVTLTGCHAILVDKITDVQRAGIIKTLDRVFVTDRKYRLPACIDERTAVIQSTGTFTVWHFALEHYDTRMNYGVYAQGLLVETSPICHMNSKNYNLV